MIYLRKHDCAVCGGHVFYDSIKHTVFCVERTENAKTPCPEVPNAHMGVYEREFFISEKRAPVIKDMLKYLLEIQRRRLAEAHSRAT